jgi:hypothetical protein
MEKITLMLQRTRLGRNRAWLNGVELDTDKSRELRDHSPGGFEWGYGGSGPAQLAVAICSELWPDLWTRIYQDFKWMYLATLTDADSTAVNIDLSEFQQVLEKAMEEKERTAEVVRRMEAGEYRQKVGEDELPF